MAQLQGRTEPAGVAELRELGLAPKLAGLVGGEVEAAQLEELAVMAEPAQVAGLRQNGHGVDATDAGNLTQALLIGVVYQCGVSLVLDRIALPDQASALSDDHAQHGDGRTDRPPRSGPDGMLVHEAFLG
jgi:hypothetical protein